MANLRGGRHCGPRRTGCPAARVHGATTRSWLRYREKHEPERTYTIWVPIKTGEVCSGYDTSRTCTPIYTPFPFQQFDDEDWKLKLEDGDKQGWLYVDEQTWRSTKIGDYIENGETSDTGNRRKPL